ncbi:hypothetical protein N4P33_12470 [Streptomyces sp. 15-116A]|uniref:hypothetical protein n=1 Tax=Streptomyces sp. 15-116A TaxID=2259035 RepID=UPI0021B27C26|nr:hypothetical protein [Streptomyces sp. 15-116A]MCT7352980.1 hypothetical protein [Streptomyces sp. 15-116A]
MKIRTTATAGLLAATALAALAPTQAFAAPQAPPCTKKNIAYLDAQNQHEDAEAKVTTAEQALDRARSDRAKVDRLGNLSEGLYRTLASGRTTESVYVASDVNRERNTLSDAVDKHDAVAAADAAVKLADATEKAMTDRQVPHDALRNEAEKYIKELRSAAEEARSATEAPNVEARQADLNAARTELTKAAKAVRPARDAYRNCLDKLVN